MMPKQRLLIELPLDICRWLGRDARRQKVSRNFLIGAICYSYFTKPKNPNPKTEDQKNERPRARSQASKTAHNL